ncbi:unnamed protein product [Rotaria sordida]|uniref:Uncharacterized protein n=1 Tax=Rotaria sordida TaxID=392033 RepID=A0A819UMN3_9BILA|nr:unnamed protein product [Rotaria sordida]CAF4096496.1 unnamed protein product [Rotaria sordida]
MKLVIIFLTVAIKCLVFGDSQEKWYKDQIETYILPYYNQAYNLLQTGVLNELLAVNVASLDDTAVSQFVNRLYCAVQRTYALLQQSVLSSENLQVEVNNRLTLNVAQAGAYEENIRGKETEVLQTNQALSNALSQLTLAEHAVIEKQNAVANADQAVRDAEEAVEKARKCRGKRSWFSKITRPIVRPIENLVKDVIIKPLTSAQNQERHSRQVVVETQIMKANLEAQLDQLRSSLANVQAALKTLRSELVVTTNINQELKQVTTQLSNVFIGSSVLQNTIAHLIDFELLINPLNAVYDAIHQITALGATTSISQSQVQQTKTNEKTDETLLYRYLPSDGDLESDLQQAQRDDQLEAQGDIDLFTFIGLLGNGPTTINFLGQIMVISSKKDFSFRASMPNATFSYVKYPDSFRATLIQLTNEAYNTFLSAHSNMNEIQLNMQQIPGHVKTALKLLATAPFPLLEKLLPLSLNNIERIGMECSNLSSITHNKFADVQLLIGEINELTGYSSGVTDQRLTETIIELNKTEAAKNSLKDKEAAIKQRYEEQAARVREAQREFNKALDKIPSGFNAIVQQAFGAVVDTFKVAMASKYCVGGLVKNCMPGPIGSTAESAKEGALQRANLALSALQLAEEQYQKTFVEMMDHYDNMKEIMIVVKNSFTKFVEWMKTAQGMGNDFLTQEIRAYYLDMLKEDVVGIHREAHLLYIMSKTYYDVSTENMMDQLAGLAKMVVASSDDERNQLKNELMQDTKVVQDKVRRLALQRKNEYELANEQRQQEIEQYIQQISLEALGVGIGRRRRSEHLFLA